MDSDVQCMWRRPPACPAPGWPPGRAPHEYAPLVRLNAASWRTIAQASLVHDVEKQITELYEWVDTTLQDL
jgi:hypothetical protein